MYQLSSGTEICVHISSEKNGSNSPLGHEPWKMSTSIGGSERKSTLTSGVGGSQATRVDRARSDKHIESPDSLRSVAQGCAPPDQRTPSDPTKIQVLSPDSNS